MVQRFPIVGLIGIAFSWQPPTVQATTSPLDYLLSQRGSRMNIFHIPKLQGRYSTPENTLIDIFFLHRPRFAPCHVDVYTNFN